MSSLPRVTRENFFALASRQRTKVATSHQSVTQSWWRRGDESGGGAPVQLSCKREPGTANGRTRPGAIGAPHTPMLRAPKSPVQRPDSYSGGPCCAEQAVRGEM